MRDRTERYAELEQCIRRLERDLDHTRDSAETWQLQLVAYHYERRVSALVDRACHLHEQQRLDEEAIDAAV